MLGRKGSAACLGIYSADVLLLNLILNTQGIRSTPSASDYIFFLALSVILVLIAKAIPENILEPRGKTDGSVKKFYLMGLLVFPLYLFNAEFPSVSNGTPRIPPAIEGPLYIIANLLILLAIVRFMPREDNRKQKFALSLGLITPLFVWAEFMQLFGVDQLITLVSVAGIVLLLRLRKWIRTGKNMADPEEYTSGIPAFV